MKNLSILILLAFCILISFVARSQASWTIQTSGTTVSLLGVSAANATVCYAAGCSGKILKTTNGGVTWLAQSSGTSEHLYSICFTDVNNGVAAGDNGAVVRTTNGGITWTSLSVTSYFIRCVYFYDASTGYMTGGLGSSGKIFKTTDGGATWASLPVSSSIGIYSIKFTSITDGYACNYNGDIFKTTDGGLSWSLLTSGTTCSLFAMYFTSSSAGIIVGSPGIVRKTTDSGATWSGVISGTSDYMTGLKFYDSNNGFAVGGNVSLNSGTILRTADGGNTWSCFTPGTARLYRVDFYNSKVGYAVGLDGTILKYINNNNVGVEEQAEQVQDIKAFPNPANGSATIDLSPLSLKGEVSVELYDATGKLISKSQADGAGSFIFNRNDLPVGLYYYNVSYENRIVGRGEIVFN
ncbi:MAG TPA: YCF48-related protein [Bacteroidia bacterium]|jgi:photosystem II stability/assembly factor-like uncharacterized protein